MEFSALSAPRFRSYGRGDIDGLAKRAGLDDAQRLAMHAVASVFPFRTSNYVVDELIDWDRAADDPLFKLTVPQPGMLMPDDLRRIVGLLRAGAPPAHLRAAVQQIHHSLNPHPAAQNTLNTVQLDGQHLPGIQHKYQRTILYFPRQGQTCHAYCSYCFRWPQFVGDPQLKISSPDADDLTRYLLAHPEVNDVLITGGDPMVMSAAVLSRFVEPLLRPELAQVESIRIGTKALSFWPYRFLTDGDADDVLRLFERVADAGRHLAIMAHFTHPREAETPAVARAIARIRATGATVRCQAPVIRGINDDAGLWARMWQRLTVLGVVPYYMFVERDTGAQHHFAIPLVDAYEIFRDAYSQVSGLARTVRGPVMSATPGKVHIDGVAQVAGEKVFTLRFIQARDPGLVGRPFFAKFDPDATWLTDLKPAFDDFPFS
jgi:KamA family protein